MAIIIFILPVEITNTNFLKYNSTFMVILHIFESLFPLLNFGRSSWFAFKSHRVRQVSTFNQKKHTQLTDVHRETGFEETQA